MELIELLSRTIEFEGSDLHITVGVPPVARIDGKLEKIGDTPLKPSDTKVLINEVLNDYQLEQLDEKGEIDISLSKAGLGRFRINVFKQRGSYGMAIRLMALEIPKIEELGLPPVLKDLADKHRGLILVTGPTGSGKSTTLASMIDYINNNRNCHILTLEDPIEYLHKHNKSIINQREVGNDSKSFATALRAALRQDPDVILVGEMRDLETISIAITAAETGHLVLSTLHTVGAVKTIDRIIDVFPPHHQQQIKVQLSTVLEGIISQQLLPRVDRRGRIAALEVMIATNAIRHLIREGKTHQLATSVQTGTKFGMQTMDSDLANLYSKGYISREEAISHCADKELLMKYMGY